MRAEAAAAVPTRPETAPGRLWERLTRAPIADEVYREEFDTFTKWRRFATSPIRGVGNLADAVENAPRRAVFEKVSTRKGASPSLGGALKNVARGYAGEGRSLDEAALRARRITVDFQRRGRAIGLMDAAFLYTNAAIQGAMLPIRAGTQMGWMPRLRMGGLVGVSAALYMWNTQDEYGEAFDEQSANDQYTKFTVMTGHKWHQRFRQLIPTSVAIAPLMREFAVFHAATTYFMKKLRGRSEKAHFGQMMTAMFPQIFPFSSLVNLGGRGGDVSWEGLPVPTSIGDLVMEIAQNRDKFRGEPIVDDEMMAREDKRTHYDSFTSRAAIQVGKIFNQSPKLMDHWMRMGALRDIVYLTDQISRHFDPEQLDPELTSMAVELEEYMESNTPEDEKLQVHPDITGTTPEDRAAEWISKNVSRVTNEYFRDVNINTTSEERRQLKEYLDKKALADRQYSWKGEPVAFATNFINRYQLSNGGNKSRLGQMKAASEFNVSVAQTREAAGKLSVVLTDMHDQQLIYDGNLWGGQRYGGTDTSDIREVPLPGDEGRNIDHYIDGQEWINMHRKKGSFYAMSIYNSAGSLVKAAQLQGIDLSKEYPDWPATGMEKYFIRDAGLYEDYKIAVATGAGAWQDTRPIASHLAAGYRGITMTELKPGDPDYSTFFDQREEFKDMVVDYRDPKTQEAGWGSKGKRISGEDMWKMVEAEITATMSNTEYEWYRDMQSIREYWDISRNYEIPDRDSRDIWTAFLNANEAQRMAMRQDTHKNLIITGIETEIADEREDYRWEHPSMEAKYIKWGYVTSPIERWGLTHPEPEAAKQWLIDNARNYSNMGVPSTPPQEPFDTRVPQPPQPTFDPMMEKAR